MLSSISKPVAAGAAIGVLAVLVAFAPARALPVDVTYNMNYAFFSPAAGKVVLQGPGSLTVEFANGTALGHRSCCGGPPVCKSKMSSPGGSTTPTTR